MQHNYKTMEVKQRNKREGNVKESCLPGRETNKKEGFENRVIQLHSAGGKKNKMGGYPATQTQKQYLQLSLFPNIVSHKLITNVSQNGNNKKASVTKDG
jgi:hypothetical protein